MMKLVYDCIRDPYDIANIMQIVLAIGVGECELYFTGNSIRHDHPKVVGKVRSWSSEIKKRSYPNFNIHYYESLRELADEFKIQRIHLIGTSPSAGKSFYTLDFKKNDFAIVFGTESGGLSKSKVLTLDEVVKIPMHSGIDFMTLSTLTPIIVYEISRQQGKFV